MRNAASAQNIAAAANGPLAASTQYGMWYALFKSVDENTNGYISYTELRDLITEEQTLTQAEEARRAARAADVEATATREQQIQESEDKRRADADAFLRRARSALDALVAEIEARRGAYEDAQAAAAAAENATREQENARRRDEETTRTRLSLETRDVSRLPPRLPPRLTLARISLDGPPGGPRA